MAVIYNDETGNKVFWGQSNKLIGTFSHCFLILLLSYTSIANVMYIYFLDLRATLVGISKYVCLQLLEFSFPSVLIPFSLIKKGMEHIKMVKTVTKCFHKYQYFIINPSRGNKLE